jgi:4,4'-diaponeurosporenoate glycosyltransferase
VPEGWRGKTWACHQGAQDATGDLLLFVDADKWFELSGLAHALSAYNKGAFSVGPYHAVRKPYEDLSLFFNLNMIVGTVPNGLFGQMLLVDRDSYRRIRGHETVRGRILENFWLATSFMPPASRSGVAGRRCVISHVPAGWARIDPGWTRVRIRRGADAARVAVLIVAWMIGLMLARCGLVTVIGSTGAPICSALRRMV